jgi:arylsulfatase A-like enzyme
MAKKPNIVLIFTDNQQASTLGCYGNSEIHTPHLDKLSSEAVTFDNAFCPNSFCSACRASLLTGLLPSQHGVHSWIDDRNMDQWPAGWHALDGLRTLPELLQEDGYKTALIGKYHLGEPTSAMSGFDHWVTLEDGHVRSFYRNRITENGENYDHVGHSVDFFTEKAVSFMEEQVADDQPFFLYLPYPAPYGHWPATKEADRCRHSARYDDCPMDSIPREAINTKAVAGYDMKKAESGGGLDFSMLMRAPNDLATLRNYYAQISMVDDGVGEVLKTLDNSGIADDTLFIFTTDHGLSVGQHGFWGHGGASFPSNLHRAAHSVPLIVRNGRNNRAGERSKLMVSNMDLFATILDIVEIEKPDCEEIVPSRSLVPILSGNSADWGEDAVYSEQEETRVIRTPKWAYFKRFDGSTSYDIDHELYDVELDPREANDLANNPDYADIQKTLDDMLVSFFDKHTRQEADLWQGGQPIQNSIRPEFWSAVWGEAWGPVYEYKDK